MLYVVIVAHPDTAQERKLSTYFNECLRQSEVSTLTHEVKYYSEAFNKETSELLSHMRENITGLLIVSAQEDLWKHPLAMLLKRIEQAHPSINLKGLPAGILVDGKDEQYTKKLCGDILNKMHDTGLYTLPPAYSNAEGEVLLSRMVDALRRAAA